MIMVVTPNPGTRLEERSWLLGIQDPSRTCSMLGFGGWGVTKNHMEAAKLSQVEDTEIEVQSNGLSAVLQDI